MNSSLNTKLSLVAIVGIAAFVISAAVVIPGNDAMAGHRHHHRHHHHSGSVNVASNHCSNEQHNGQNNANVGNTGAVANTNTVTGNVNTQNCNAANISQRG